MGGLWWSPGDGSEPTPPGEERQTCRPGYTRHVIANRCYHPIMQVKWPSDYMTGRGTVNIAIKQLGGCIVLAYSVIA